MREETREKKLNFSCSSSEVTMAIFIKPKEKFTIPINCFFAMYVMEHQKSHIRIALNGKTIKWKKKMIEKNYQKSKTQKQWTPHARYCERRAYVFGYSKQTPKLNCITWRRLNNWMRKRGSLFSVHCAKTSKSMFISIWMRYRTTTNQIKNKKRR